MNKDTFKTITTVSEGLYKSKGSKFISFAIPINSESEITDHLNYYKKNFHDARHHCYAYMLGSEKDIYRVNDDGEPSNSAGKPILGQILSADLTNVLIIVVRYFGGTLLGVGGLISAYKSAAADAINNAKINSFTIDDFFEINCTYDDISHIMKLIKDENLEVVEQKLEIKCFFKIKVRKSKTYKIKHVLDQLYKINYKYITV